MTLETFKLPEHLEFHPTEGLIRFAGARMMLFNEQALAVLRSILAEQTGAAMSRMMFAKFGYESAIRDFESLVKILPNLSDAERLTLGPMMHSWSGIVSVRPEIMEMDRARGHFHFKGRWYNSYEAKAHLAAHGPSQTPVCFSLTGYGSGWCTAYFGRRLLEIETKCVACGDEYCEWEIRPWDEWDESADPWKESLSDTSRSIHADLESSLAELRALNESLEETVDRRTLENREQLRTLCHDLDAPIQLAISDLRARLAADPSPELTRALRVLGNVDKMIHRARESQAVTEGKRVPRLTKFHLRQLVDEALDLVRTRLRDKDMTISCDVSAELFVTADLDVLRDHVLVNILTNAIKFSARGSRVRVAAERYADGRVALRIIDEGIGIPPEILAGLFNPKSKTSRRGTDGENGTGYGVPLMKAYMRHMRGDVTITSKPICDYPFDHGTTVTCWFEASAKDQVSVDLV